MSIGGGAAGVHGHDEIETRHGRLVHRFPPKGARVVDDHVDAAEAIERRARGGFDAAEIGDIAADRKHVCAVLGDLVGGGENGAGEPRVFLGAFRGDDNVVPFAGETVGAGLADAAGRSSDERYFSHDDLLNSSLRRPRLAEWRGARRPRRSTVQSGSFRRAA